MQGVCPNDSAPFQSMEGGVKRNAHEVKVLRGGVERGHLSLLAAVAVQAVVVVEADDGGLLGDEGVGLGVAACRRLGVSAKEAGHTAHEGGLAAACRRPRSPLQPRPECIRSDTALMDVKLARTAIGGVSGTVGILNWGICM